jgi:hypothetical protein
VPTAQHALLPIPAMLALQLLFLVAAGFIGIANATPKQPRLKELFFADDGGSITVVFDSEVEGPIDFGTTDFVCSSVFRYPGDIHTGTCQFLSTSRMIAFLNIKAYVGVGDAFAILPGVLRTKCPNGWPLTQCTDYPFVEAYNIILTQPANPLVPVVVIPSTIAASLCAPPKLDLSLSYGSGGRLFHTSVVTVTAVTGASPAAAEALRAYLASSEYLIKAVSIPVALLEGGASYSITVTLCNYLSTCNSGTALLAVQSQPLPYVKILGNPTRSVSVAAAIKIDGDASLPLCDGSLLPVSQLVFAWTVETAGGAPVAVVQTSVNKMKFALPAYSLPSGVTYSVVLTVYNSLVPSQVSSARASVTVSRAPVVAAVVSL